MTYTPKLGSKFKLIQSYYGSIKVNDIVSISNYDKFLSAFTDQDIEKKFREDHTEVECFFWSIPTGRINWDNKHTFCVKNLIEHTRFFSYMICEKHFNV